MYFLKALKLAALMMALLCATTAQAQNKSWTGDDASLVFFEALTTVGKEALNPPNSREFLNSALRAALKDIDQYSDYWPIAEYKAFKEANNPKYAGVGMDIWRSRQGDIVCIPHQGSPAQEAGVLYGDVLVAVDGKPVSDQGFYMTGAMIRGETGRKVTLELSRQGKTITIPITRRKLDYPSVHMVNLGSLPRMRIWRFSSHTAKQVAEALTSLQPKAPLIIDLRGNVGGDLMSAIEAAALFLPQGAAIVTKRQRKEATRYRATQPPLDPRRRVFIWQDGLTASAAEVFTAAMVQNNRAKSVGETTFGKGVAQNIIELSDGSALLLTYADLIPPSGEAYHGKGLAPSFSLKPGAQGTDRDYALITALAMSNSPIKKTKEK